MESPNLIGPYQLNENNIQQIVPDCPGVYTLGFPSQRQNNAFVVERVGRSDNDIRERLGSHIANSDYSHFMYCYTSSAFDAFVNECHLYHDYDSAENLIHPDRPNGTNWSCPRCDQLD